MERLHSAHPMAVRRGLEDTERPSLAEHAHALAMDGRRVRDRGCGGHRRHLRQLAGPTDPLARFLAFEHLFE